MGTQEKWENGRAAITEEHRALASYILWESGVVSNGSRNPGRLEQILANYAVLLSASPAEAEKRGKLWAHCPLDCDDKEDFGDPYCHADRDGDCVFDYCPMRLQRDTLAATLGAVEGQGERPPARDRPAEKPQP